MTEISYAKCVILLKEKYSKFITYWNKYLEEGGPAEGPFPEMIPFCDYVLDVIKNEDFAQAENILNTAEYLLCHGDESVKNAIATMFLEDLMHAHPDQINFETIAKYLGKESKGYCRAWDKFTGCRTPGLWDEEGK